jgi:peroxiredoxin Q/BCP
VTGVIRSTFVIGEDGTLEKVMYNVRAKGHVAKLRSELGV